MKDKEQQLKSYKMLSKEEGNLLTESLARTLGRVPTEEEIESLLNWAVEVRCADTLLNMVIKGLKDIGLKIDEDSKSGKLDPIFYNTAVAEEIIKKHNEEQKALKIEGEEVLKDILGE